MGLLPRGRWRPVEERTCTTDRSRSLRQGDWRWLPDLTGSEGTLYECTGSQLPQLKVPVPVPVPVPIPVPVLVPVPVSVPVPVPVPVPTCVERDPDPRPVDSQTGTTGRRPETCFLDVEGPRERFTEGPSATALPLSFPSSVPQKGRRETENPRPRGPVGDDTGPRESYGTARPGPL